MKILLANINDLQPIPPPDGLIRADTYVSVPLAMELKKRGHDVFFLCPKNSNIETKKIFTSCGSLFSIIPIDEFFNITNLGLRSEIIAGLQLDLYLNLIEICQKEKFDLVHLHTNNPLAELVVSKKVKAPFLFTLHGVCLYPDTESRLKKIFEDKKNYFVSISNYQRKCFPAFNFIKTIYNGLEIDNFPFSKKGGQSMLFSGRLKKTKGIKEAIAVALKTERKLEITGALSLDPVDRANFTENLIKTIKENDNLLTYHGLINRKNVSAFYGNSKLLISPTNWEEPFGLIFTESMACGTPVVAFARGSVPEIIKDGQTGFIVNSSDNDIRGDWIIKKTGVDGLIEAVNKIYEMAENEYLIMRQNCRNHVEENFTIEKMVDGYEAAYKKILKIK